MSRASNGRFVKKEEANSIEVESVEPSKSKKAVVRVLTKTLNGSESSKISESMNTILKRYCANTKLPDDIIRAHADRLESGEYLWKCQTESKLIRFVAGAKNVDDDVMTIIIKKWN
jgi:hypothetical protein